MLQLLDPNEIVRIKYLILKSCVTEMVAVSFKGNKHSL